MQFKRSISFELIIGEINRFSYLFLHMEENETERVSSEDRSRVLLLVNPSLQSGFQDMSPGSGLMHEERESGETDWRSRIRAALINPDDVSTPPPTSARDRAARVTSPIYGQWRSQDVFTEAASEGQKPATSFIIC